MGTEVLRPQDCLIDRFRGPPVAFHYRRKELYGSPNANFTANPNPRVNRKPAVRSDRSDQKKQPSVPKQRSRSAGEATTRTGNVNLVMEKVTILRRGQSLNLDVKSNEKVPKKEDCGKDLIIASDPVPKKEDCDTDLIVSDPAPKKKDCDTDLIVSDPIKVIVDLMSPMIGKGNMYAGSSVISPAPSSVPLPSFPKKILAVDDSATRDLRRLLRLEY